jgi:DNA polymerase I-like protein with 3'-5' exonuclease and polymerase domains
MGVIFLDTETTGLDYKTCKLVTVQMMTESGKSKIIKDPETLNKLKSKLENNLIIGHNLKFDSKFLKYHYGITLYNVYDTFIAEIVLSGGLIGIRKTSQPYQSATLKDVIHRYCGVDISKEEQCGFKRGLNLTQEQEDYAISDLKYLPDIVAQQKAKAKQLGLENIINIEMKALPAMVWLELSGMYIDIEKLNSIKVSLESKRSEAQLKLYQAFSSSKIKLNSSSQLVKALNNLGIPVRKADEEELSKFNDPVIEVLKEYKETEKLLNTFVNKMPNYIDKSTGRVHSNFKQIGAKTGRLSSSKPNLQQQPSKYGEWRSIYKAAPGNKIITADYSQIELRIIGQVSQEPEYINAYCSGMDLHSLTASKVFKVPIEKFKKPMPEEQKKQRSIAKTVNFGIAYGMWSQGLQRKLQTAGIETTVEEAEQIIRNYYKSYPKVSTYLQNVSESGLRELKVINKAGRLMLFEPPLDEREKGSIKRESKNLPIQSLCADMVKTAIAEIFLKLEHLGVLFINTVHDEIVLECKEEQVEYVIKVVKEEMEIAGKKYLTDMPCISEVSYGDMWEK